MPTRLALNIKQADSAGAEPPCLPPQLSGRAGKSGASGGRVQQISNLIVAKLPASLTVHSDLEAKTDEDVNEVVHSLTEPMLRHLPHEIRDMIYQELCDTSDEPFYVIDNNIMPPWPNEYCFEPLIETFELPYWMDPWRVDEEFAAEAAHTWYKNSRLSIDIKLLSSLIYDVGGVLVGSRGPRMRARDLITRLTIYLPGLPLHLEYANTTLPSDEAATYHRAALELYSPRSQWRKGQGRLQTPPRHLDPQHRYCLALCGGCRASFTATEERGL
jgi:hypothetical protein